MENETDNCGSCFYFYQTSENKGGQRIGYCRCNPPIPYFEMDQSRGGIIVPRIGRFPVVLDNMWCGYFDYKTTGKKTLTNAGKNATAATNGSH